MKKQEIKIVNNTLEARLDALEAAIDKATELVQKCLKNMGKPDNEPQ